jgi:hypothetical protein
MYVQSSYLRFIIARLFVMGGTSAQFSARKVSLLGRSGPMPSLVGRFLYRTEQGENADTPFIAELRETLAASGDIKTHEDWPRQHQWIKETARTFLSVFKPRLALE